MELKNDVKIRQGSLTLVTGPSGSGKSQSLPLMLSRLDCSLELVEAPTYDMTTPLIDLFGCDARGIRAINAVGLADATTFGRNLQELSVGQKARAELGLALLDDREVILVDEYLAFLDRPTAKAVAWASQRAIRSWGKTAIFITAHDDLTEYLQPDIHFIVGWEPEPEIVTRQVIPQSCGMLDEITIEKGSSNDWIALRPLHYAAGNPATVMGVYVARHPEITGPAGVIVVSYPDLHSAARNLATDSRYQNVTDRRVTNVLNREVAKISRIVVCPQLRGIGLAYKLLEYVVPRLNVRYVECVTSMSRWSSFLERVGFREVPQTSHPIEAALVDWASQVRPPPGAYLDGATLMQWVETLTVRKTREARRIIWAYYFHFVLHRKTRANKPKKIPGPSDAGWGDAADLAARRLVERPAYWIMGPIDPASGLPEEVEEELVATA